ncbi:hypothetical protein BDA96_06G094100 [Sorghum bicolor]|uniref:Uncharacterized protein n=1 Tax=Sorghum bicolor TaxID=4558 RepID=A0A921QPH7_SORBI|nr:hypothetical protein BDA96_06G094100 [Sorghum bicolor]
MRRQPSGCHTTRPGRPARALPPEMKSPGPPDHHRGSGPAVDTADRPSLLRFARSVPGRSTPCMPSDPVGGRVDLRASPSPRPRCVYYVALSLPIDASLPLQQITRSPAPVTAATRAYGPDRWIRVTYAVCVSVLPAGATRTEDTRRRAGPARGGSHKDKGISSK